MLPTPRATTSAASFCLAMTRLARLRIPPVAPGLRVVARLLSSNSPGPASAVTSSASVRCRLLESRLIPVDTCALRFRFSAVSNPGHLLPLLVETF